MMTENFLNDGKFDSMTADQLKKVREDFNKAVLDFIPYRVSIESRMEKENPALSDEEKALYKAVLKVSRRITEKTIIMDYLITPNKEELMHDLEALNQRDGVNKNSVEFYTRAQLLQDMYLSKVLTPGALFEKDPSAGRSVAMGQLMKSRKNIQDVHRRMNQISKVKWKDGKRDLSGVPEFEAQLLMRNQHGTHRVVQYVDRSNTTVKDIITASLSTMPLEMKRKKVKVNIPAYDPENPDVLMEEQKEMTVEEGIWAYYNSMVEAEKATALHKTQKETTDPEAMIKAQFDLDSLNDGGFLLLFTNGELEDNLSLQDYLRDMNRNVYNVGGTKDAAFETDQAEGYNRGKAIDVQAKLIHDAGLPDQFMPTVERLSDMQFQYGHARPNEKYTVDVVVAQDNYERTTPGTAREFYTTTKDFRKSAFVGMSAKRIPATNLEEERDKMNVMDLAQLEDNMPELKKRVANGPTKFEEYTRSVENFEFYDQGTILANMADLAVMDYLMAAPKRKPSDLRIGFQMEKGKIKLTNVLGAQMDTELLTDAAPNDPRIYRPEDMMAMTEEMVDNVKRWAKREYSQDVLDLLKKMPTKNREAFQKRVETLAAYIELQEVKQSEETIFNDLEDPSIPLQVKKGELRILPRKEFKRLRMDELAVARDEVPIEKRNQPFEMKNIFDALAELPKESNKALADKWAADWAFEASEEYGVVSKKNRKDYEAELKKPIVYEAFNHHEVRRNLMKVKRMMGDVLRMDSDRTDEYATHIMDSSEYSGVFDSYFELSDLIVAFSENSDRSRESYARLLAKRQDEVAARNKEIAEENKKILEENKKIEEENKAKQGQKSKKKWYSKLWPFEKSLPEGEERKRNKEIDEQNRQIDRYNESVKDEKDKLTPLKKPERIPMSLSRSEMDLYDPKNLVSVRKGMEKLQKKLQKKLEKYLTKKRYPKSDFGKKRYAMMEKLYYDLNNRIAEYILTTGDTDLYPHVLVKDDAVPFLTICGTERKNISGAYRRLAERHKDKKKNKKADKCWTSVGQGMRKYTQLV